MAAITWTQVVLIAPELAEVETDAQTLILEYVNEELDPDDWGGESSVRLKRGRIYLAAHCGALALPREEGGLAGGASGLVTSVQEGDARVAFSSLADILAGGGDGDALMLTPYGQEFDRLRASGGFSIGLVP